MSVGFGVGLTRQFCPVTELSERVELLERVVRELELPVLRDFVHRSPNPDWTEISEPSEYGIVEVQPEHDSVSWNWLSAEEVSRIRTDIGGRHWSDSGSFEECMLLVDEETSLVLSGVPEKHRNRRGKGLLKTTFPGYQGSLVYIDATRAVQNLEARLDEQPDSGFLLRGLELMKLCGQHKLPFHLAWGTS